MATIHLPEQDLRRLLDAADRCQDTGGCGPADVEAVLDAVTDLVGCDIALWKRYHLAAELGEHRVSGPRAGRSRCAGGGPLLEPRSEHSMVSGPHGAVVMLSDVLPVDALTDAWLYREAMAPSRIHSELCLELSHDTDDRNVIVLSRAPGRAFTETDRLVLRLIRPIVDQAIHHFMRPGVRATPRESDVLRLVREGLTNAQIARRLGIAESTVAKHLEHVYARTGAQGRAQAVAMCWEALVVAAGA